MFFVLLLIICLSTLHVSYLHMMGNTNKNLMKSLWAIATITSAIMCCYLAHTNLVFVQGKLPNVNLMDTLLDVNYLVYFIKNILLLVAIVTVYYILRIRLNIKPLWFLTALLIASLIIYYSGVAFEDTQHSYGQYLQHNYQLWQPPFFTIWWQIFHIYRASFIAGTVIYYSSLIYISYLLEQNSKKWQNDLLVLFSLNPIVFTQIVLDAKDVSYTGVLLAAVATYLYINKINTKYLQVFGWLLYYTCLFFAFGFRVNALLAILPLIFISIYTILPNKIKFKVTLTTSISLLIASIFFIAINLINTKVFQASNPHFQSQAMLTDMTYIECNTNHSFQMAPFYFKQPDRPELNQLGVCNYLNYQDADLYYPGLNNWMESNMIAHYSQIKHDWITALTSYPLVYLSYRARFFLNDLFFQYWYPSGISNIVQKKLNTLAFFQHFTVKFLLSIFLAVGTIVCLFLCLYFKIYNMSFALALSNLFQLIGYYFLIPAHAARYFYWDYMCIILSIGLLTISLNQQAWSKNKKFNS